MSMRSLPARDDAATLARMEATLPEMFESPLAAEPTAAEIAALAAWLSVSTRTARACCRRLRTVAAAVDAANDGPDLAPMTRWRTALRMGARLLTVEAEGPVADAASRLLARLDDDGRRITEGALRVLVTRCLTERRVLAIEYWNASAATWEPRSVEPLALSHADGHWTLLAFCRTRRDLRSFRFDRVRAASVAEGHFEARHGLSLERFLLRTKGEPPPRLAG
jgi:predicted DNA-binding transcriptional regulator YafY